MAVLSLVTLTRQSGTAAMVIGLIITVVLLVVVCGYPQVVRVEALASQAGPVEVAALSHPAQQSLEQQQAVQAARQGPQDLAARRAQATRWVCWHTGNPHPQL